MVFLAIFPAAYMFPIPFLVSSFLDYSLSKGDPA